MHPPGSVELLLDAAGHGLASLTERPCTHFGSDVPHAGSSSGTEDIRAMRMTGRTKRGRPLMQDEDDLEDSQAKKRNREAQRRFRARQKVLIEELKEQLVALTDQANVQAEELQQLRKDNAALRQENAALRQQQQQQQLGRANSSTSDQGHHDHQGGWHAQQQRTASDALPPAGADAQLEAAGEGQGASHSHTPRAVAAHPAAAAVREAARSARVPSAAAPGAAGPGPAASKVALQVPSTAGTASQMPAVASLSAVLKALQPQADPLLSCALRAVPQVLPSGAGAAAGPGSGAMLAAGGPDPVHAPLVVHPVAATTGAAATAAAVGTQDPVQQQLQGLQQQLWALQQQHQRQQQQQQVVMQDLQPLAAAAGAGVAPAVAPGNYLVHTQGAAPGVLPAQQGPAAGWKVEILPPGCQIQQGSLPVLGTQQRMSGGLLTFGQPGEGASQVAALPPGFQLMSLPLSMLNTHAGQPGSGSSAGVVGMSPEAGGMVLVPQTQMMAGQAMGQAVQVQQQQLLPPGASAMPRIVLITGEQLQHS